MSLTGIGTDYLINYTGGDPEDWKRFLTFLKPWVAKGYVTSRLGFVFPNSGAGLSVLDYAKFDRVLELFSAEGVRIIPLMQNSYYETDVYLGTPAFIDNWLEFTRHYRGDSRIAAFSIFGEPNSNTKNLYGNFSVQQRFKELIDQIHAQDSDRVIIYPTGQLSYESAAAWIRDLETVGVVNNPKVVFDIIHPYLFEDYRDIYAGITPEDAVQWYLENWIKPCKNAFGAERCFCGETFCFQEDSEHYHQSMQVRYLTAQINSFIENGIAFDIWATLNYLQYQEQTWTFQAMNAAKKPNIDKPKVPASGQANVNGAYYLGYAATLPAQVVKKLWLLRERFIRKDVHKKLHPLI